MFRFLIFCVISELPIRLQIAIFDALEVSPTHFTASRILKSILSLENEEEDEPLVLCEVCENYRRSSKAEAFLQSLALKSLRQYKNSQHEVFGIVLGICRLSATPGSEGQSTRRSFCSSCWVVEEFGQKPVYEKLDDALVDASLRLLQKDGAILDAHILADEIAHERELRAKRELGMYCSRALELFKEVSVQQTSRMVAAKVSEAQSLPLDVAKSLGDALIDTHGIPWRMFIRLWSAPRPPFPSQKCGCKKSTCSDRSFARWLKSTSEWVVIHQAVSYLNTEARCHRKQCDGHYDEDFRSGDWKVIDNQTWRYGTWRNRSASLITFEPA